MKEVEDLNNVLDKGACTGLNIEGDGNAQGVFFGSPIQCIDGDGEMIIIAKFIEKVSITQILFEGGMDKEKTPEYVKIFAHNDCLDFGDAEEAKATDVFKLEGNLSKKIKVSAPKYRNCSELSMYFKNTEASQIQMNNIQFYGYKDGTKVDFGEMKKNPVS